MNLESVPNSSAADHVTWQRGLLLAGVPVLLWSAQAVYMKFLLDEQVGPFELGLYRSGGAVLLGLMLWRASSRLPRWSGVSAGDFSGDQLRGLQSRAASH